MKLMCSNGREKQYVYDGRGLIQTEPTNKKIKLVSGMIENNKQREGVD